MHVLRFKNVNFMFKVTSDKELKFKQVLPTLEVFSDIHRISNIYHLNHGTVS